MEKYDLNVNKETVSWNYENKIYNLKISRLEDASIDTDKYIYVENSNTNNEEQIQYYTLERKLLFQFIRETGLLSWKKEDRTIKLVVGELKYAEIYENYQIIVILKGEKYEERKLIMYSLDG